MAETLGFTTIYTKQARIAQLAEEAPEMAFTTLAHHMDMEWMKEAYRRTRKGGAVGVDGQTAEEYEADLEGNLARLLERAKSGTYRAPPVKRVHIPKGDGKQTRPIGIPTFEDKVLQRAVVMVLEPIYERDFLGCSYAFRTGRSAHQALETLWKTTMKMRGGWVLEIDIRKFFDTLDHAHLRAIIQQRIRDGVLLRLIGKWLNAGVQEAGCLSYPEAGSPQGGVISPMLANAYLHKVLDLWFEKTVKPLLKGKATLIRYADDAVIGFEQESDARKVLEVLPKRFGKYGLTLHPEKTRLVNFSSPTGAPKKEDQEPPPGTFDFLGFTHYWGTSQKGNWVVKRKTAKDRFTRALKAVSKWCRKHRHEPITEQWQELRCKLSGHKAYYGLIGNAPMLSRFVLGTKRIWKKWLSRRSNESYLTWEQFGRLLAHYPLETQTRAVVSGFS
jgi:group II intron reverse transcriptase/maturase